MFSFSFFQTVSAAQEQEAQRCIAAVLQRRGTLSQTSTASAVCFQGTLGTVGIFRHACTIQCEHHGSQVKIIFTSRQYLTGKGCLLALASVILAFAALCAGPWFLTVELAAVAGVTILAMENAHARKDILRGSLEAQEALRLLHR